MNYNVQVSIEWSNATLEWESKKVLLDISGRESKQIIVQRKKGWSNTQRVHSRCVSLSFPKNETNRDFGVPWPKVSNRRDVMTLWRHGVVFRFWAAVPVFPPRFSPNSHQAWMIQRAIVSTQKNVKTKWHHMCVFIIAFIEYIIDDTWWIQQQFHLMTQHNVHLYKAECETTGIWSNSHHANLGWINESKRLCYCYEQW